MGDASDVDLSPDGEIQHPPGGKLMVRRPPDLPPPPRAHPRLGGRVHSTLDMLMEAIRSSEASGSGPASVIYIKNYIHDTYEVEAGPLKSRLKKAIVTAFSKELIERPKKSEYEGPSLMGKFKLVKPKPATKKPKKDSKETAKGKETTKQKTKETKAAGSGEERAPRKRKKKAEVTETDEEAPNKPTKRKPKTATKNKRLQSKSPLGSPPRAARITKRRMATEQEVHSSPEAAARMRGSTPETSPDPEVTVRAPSAIRARGSSAGATPRPKSPAKTAGRTKAKTAAAAAAADISGPRDASTPLAGGAKLAAKRKQTSLAAKRKGSMGDSLTRTPAAVTRTKTRARVAKAKAPPRKPKALGSKAKPAAKKGAQDDLD